MAIAYNFKKGTDLPAWHWLSQYPPGASDPGTSNVYDGSRYMYWIVQRGTTTAGTASTTELYRYDTWTDGWQFMATMTSGNQGIDIEYDAGRNVLYIMDGAALTSWHVYNLNRTSVTIAGVACAAFALTTMTPVLPATSTTGASFTQPEDTGLATVLDSTGIAGAGGSSTSVVPSTDFFTPAHLGSQITFTSGTQNGKTGIITALSAPAAGAPAVATISGNLTGGPAAGDTFGVARPSGTATGAQTTGTLQDTTNTWPVNQYSNWDVVITSGTGAGQRRRIASNTAAILTLAGAVTGNANTGNWTTTPDATSVYQITPSNDFLYFLVGNSTTAFWKIDLSSTAPPAWVSLAVTPAAIGGGSNTMFPGSMSPGYIWGLRGSGTSTIYYYNIGTNAWATLTTFFGGQNFNTGANSATLSARKKLWIQKDTANHTYMLDLTTGLVDAGPMVPYATPSGIDGKRTRYIKTADGVEWLYALRAGGQEFFRCPVEWL